MKEKYYIRIISYSKQSGTCLDEENEINFVSSLESDGLKMTDTLSRALSFATLNLVNNICDYLNTNFQTTISNLFKYEFRIVKLELL